MGHDAIERRKIMRRIDRASFRRTRRNLAEHRSESRFPHTDIHAPDPLPVELRTTIVVAVFLFDCQHINAAFQPSVRIVENSPFAPAFDRDGSVQPFEAMIHDNIGIHRTFALFVSFLDFTDRFAADTDVFIRQFFERHQKELLGYAGDFRCHSRHLLNKRSFLFGGHHTALDGNIRHILSNIFLEYKDSQNSLLLSFFRIFASFSPNIVMSPVAVIITVLGYILLLFVFARISSRKAGNAAFFTGNRRTPWYMAASAMIAAAMSGVTFISVPGSVAADAFSYMQMVMGFTVGQFIIAFVLVPTFYRLRVVSLYEYLDTRFGITSHHTGAWFFFISKMSGTALKVYIVCAVMQGLVFNHYGIPFWANAALTMTFVWLYTQRGGVKTLIWTDTLKTVCLVASLVLTIVYLMRGMGWSLANTAQQVAASPMSRIFFFDDPASGYYFWKMFSAGIVLLVAMTGLDQDMMQRNLSCATPRDSQKNIILTAFCQIFVILLFLVLGVLLYRYVESTGLPMPAKSDQVFAQVAVNGGLPLAVGVLFVIGLISSTYSSAGSALTALTTSFTVDILTTTKHDNDQALTRTRRIVHIAMAACMAVVILGFEYCADDSVINLVYKVAGYTYGPILGMFVFGMSARRRIKDRWMPLVAIAAPLLSGLLQYVARTHWHYQIGFELLIYNAAFTMLGMLLLTKKR